MGSIGGNKANTGVADTTQYKGGTQGVDSISVMYDAKFKNLGSLLSTINRADNRRFDIINRTGDSEYGKILYQDSLGSDDDAYEVTFQKTYANDANPGEIQITKFRHYEAGEW